MTLLEELDALIALGKELAPKGGGSWSLGNSELREEYTSWRLRCLSAIRELGAPAEHLLKIVSNRGFARFYKPFAEEILSATVAARSIALRTGGGRALERPDVEAGSVFVVHGHDQAVLQQTARLLQQLGLKPVILFEEAAKGRTIIEKLEQRSNASAAVVLLTPDDVGAPAGEPLAMKARARQNVILELGYFLGLLGRKRVVVLYTDGVELPSDYVGVEYIKLDSDGAWKLRVARELRAADLDVDLNRLA